MKILWGMSIYKGYIMYLTLSDRVYAQRWALLGAGGTQGGSLHPQEQIQPPQITLHRNKSVSTEISASFPRDFATRGRRGHK